MATTAMTKTAGKGRATAPKMSKMAGSPSVPSPLAIPDYTPVYDNGGGYSMGPAPAPAPQMSLDDYINSNFFFQQQSNENDRLLGDFDSETLRLRQETEADQGLRRQMLQNRLDDLGVESAEGLASRGLLRSGLNFKAQDRIDEFGVEQGAGIDQLMTNLLSQRTGGRLSQEQANRAALNQRIAELTSQFNASQAI